MKILRTEGGMASDEIGYGIFCFTQYFLRNLPLQSWMGVVDEEIR